MATLRDCTGPSPSWRTERRRNTDTLARRATPLRRVPLARVHCELQRCDRNQGGRARGPLARAFAGLPDESGPSRSARAHARKLRQADRQDRAEIRRRPAQGAVRSAHVRNLPRLARRACAQVKAAGRLRFSGIGAGAVVGEGSRQDHGQSVRARRTSYGASTTRRHSSNTHRRIYTCRSCSRCGPASARAISCACPGPPMMGLTSGCANQRPARAWSFRSLRRSRPRSTRQGNMGRPSEGNTPTTRSCEGLSSGRLAAVNGP